MIKNLLTSLKLEIIVFACGALVMILEIVGSRLLAPFLGTSTYVWTSLIGVVLGSLAVGYYLGGKLADKQASFKILGNILFISQITLLITVILENAILSNLQPLKLDPRILATFAGLILFSPTSVLLGMVSPYCVKLKLEDLKSSGATIGRLYALSTIGSIFGTFLTGFVLFSAIGTQQILFLLLLTLGILSVFCYPHEKISYFKVSVLILTLIIFAYAEYVRDYNSKRGLIDLDTSYNRIWIVDTKNYENRKIRYMLIDKAFSSSIYLDSPNHEPFFEYIKLFGAYKYYQPNPKKVLLLGGAAYTFPREFLSQSPDSLMDVVEIDPEQTEIAKKYFYLKDDSRIRSIHEDGRTYLNSFSKGSEIKKYDVIFIDAFSALYSMPFHLLTQEFFEKVSISVDEQGVVVINLIAALDGKSGRLFKYVYSTLKSVFPYVHVYAVSTSKFEITQNLVLAATKNPIFNNDSFSTSILTGHVVDSALLKKVEGPYFLTDNFAPVEALGFELYKSIP